MIALDVYEVPLAGMRLIEASAGTGKTWTITGLYLRLLLSGDYTVEQILVVTFTKAATAELRERIRDRISEVRRALLDAAACDPFCQWVLEHWQGEEREKALAALEQARRSFDQATIFTIHGFCQRVLSDFQIPDLLDEPDLVPDEASLLPGLVAEAWIRHCHSPLLAGVLASSDVRPDTVVQDLRAIMRKPYLHIEGREQGGGEAELAAAWQGLKARWQDDKAAIAEDALGADGLSRDQKKYKAIADMVDRLAACMETAGIQIDPVLRKLTADEFEAARLKKGRLPQHDFWEAMGAFWQQADGVVDGFRQTLIADVREALVTSKRDQQQIAYQDLLVLLNERAQEPAFAEAIRATFTAALIDEFQDTDPLQFGIFKNIYAEAEAPVFMVGDPKQAIYSFRGADIFTYFGAADVARETYTLDTNRRSVPKLVTAVNTLFAGHQNSFLLDRLGFQAVNAIEAEDELVADDDYAAFECWLLPDNEGKPLSKEQAGASTVDAVASEIARLLQAGAEGRAHIGGDTLAACDIAVLVATHRHGRAVHEALAARGVASVVRSQSSVYESGEALAMLRLLEAVAEPGRDGLVKAALLSEFVGTTLDQVLHMADDDARWGTLIEALLGLRERWQRQGFMVMWEGLLDHFAIFERLVALSDGERRLTNLRHLATLMQQEADLEPALERQLAWLREQIVGGERNEETQLRLESDAERVQILTIHVSKGLEFPVVFCPFLWDGALLRRDERERAEYHADRGAVLDLGSVHFPFAMEAMARERLAEKLRLLYVALTRAKYRCYACWGAVKEVETAALSWLLLGQGLEADPAAIKAALKGLDRNACAEALESLAQRSEGALAWRDLPDGEHVFRAPAVAVDSLRLPEATRALYRLWSVSSFTGLTANAHELELPDHDATVVAPAVAEDIVPEGIHAFPRGAQPGVFWHELLENFVVDTVENKRQFIEDRLHKFGIDTEWLPLVESHLDVVLHSPLGADGMTLASLEGAIAEMEFTYPVTRLSLERLQRAAQAADIAPAYHHALALLDFSTLNGYLKGFIDLICRHQGKYYVLDYKTNWLGPVAASYTPFAMQQSVAESHYYLQYWLYTLALHRHLRVSLPGYDYDRHMGGARYLYLRGMDGSGQYGVYSNRPPRALIESLDKLLEGH